jgi:hypothetical protein
MACHETTYCPRCQAAFECKVGTIQECQCNGIPFNEAEKAHIAAHYQECLCRNCLLAMKREVKYKPVKEKFQFILSIFTAR